MTPVRANIVGPPAFARSLRIREIPDWKEHAAALEAEMLRREMFFEIIHWSEDQTTLPFEE